MVRPPMAAVKRKVAEDQLHARATGLRLPNAAALAHGRGISGYGLEFEGYPGGVSAPKRRQRSASALDRWISTTSVGSDHAPPGATSLHMPVLDSPVGTKRVPSQLHDDSL